MKTTNHKPQAFFKLIALVLFSFAIVSCDSGAGKLNDTGIRWSGNYPKGNNAVCADSDLAQDCSHGRDAKAIAGTLTKVGGGVAGFDFTKLGADGSVLNTQDATWSETGSESSGTKWSCVKDNHTGLIWEVKNNDGSSPTGKDPTISSDNIHHKDNKYRWGGKTAIGRDHASKEGYYYNDWNSLIDGSNSDDFCGANDWRVPTREELRSIVYYGKDNPAIDDSYFPNTRNGYFWSASPIACYSDFAWLLDFDYGSDDSNLRSSNHFVWLVRGGQ